MGPSPRRYLLYEAAAYTVESNNLHWVHRKVVENRYPSVSGSDVDDPFGQAMRDTRFHRRSRVLTVAAWLRFPVLVIVPTLAAYVFEVHAFVQLLRHDEVSVALTSVAAASALALLILSISRVATEVPHGEAPWNNGREKGGTSRGCPALRGAWSASGGLRGLAAGAGRWGGFALARVDDDDAALDGAAAR